MRILTGLLIALMVAGMAFAYTVGIAVDQQPNGIWSERLTIGTAVRGVDVGGAIVYQAPKDKLTNPDFAYYELSASKGFEVLNGKLDLGLGVRYKDVADLTGSANMSWEL